MRAYLIGGLRRLEFQESCPVFRFQSNFPVKADAHTMPLGRNSSSASRLTAGALGFFILSQSRERPLRLGEPFRFETMPSSPSLQACLSTIGPSPSMWSLNQMP